jgi:apolipoprotein N-acyltransferase
MAVLRGVENGFSEVRTARQGRLTISDCYGRVTAEATCAVGKNTILLGDLPLKKMSTIYRQTGNLFGILNLIAAGYFVLLIIMKAKKGNVHNLQ